MKPLSLDDAPTVLTPADSRWPSAVELAEIANLAPIADQELSIVYYGEFDAFSGNVPYDMRWLPRVVAHLKLLLAVCDGVTMSPGSMLSHPLALPAFEALGPFARSGRLGTSGTAGMTPLAYLMDRAERRAGLWRVSESSTHGNSRRLWYEEAHQKVRARWAAVGATNEALDRWGLVLPDVWAVERDVTAVVAGYTDRVDHALRSWAAEGRRLPAQLRARLDRARQAGQAIVDRSSLLAWLSTMRGDGPLPVLSRLVALVQAPYFIRGMSARAKRTASGERVPHLSSNSQAGAGPEATAVPRLNDLPQRSL